MRGALSECVCVRLWPLCAPVNRSQCARGRQNWNSTPPISDQRKSPRSAMARCISHLALNLAEAVTTYVRDPDSDADLQPMANPDSADLSACAWSWWRGARELPARAGAGARRALSYTHCHAKLAGPRGERAWTRERGPRAAAGYKALCALGLGLLIGLPSTVPSSSEPAVWNRAVPDSRRQTRTGRCAERHGDSVLCDRSLRGALC